MDRIIMVTAALLFVFGSAACRTPEQHTEETRPPVEAGSPPVVTPSPSGDEEKPQEEEEVSPPVEVGPPKTPSEEEDGSDGEVRLARLDRRVVELEALVAGLRERVAHLHAKSPVPRLEKAKSDLDREKGVFTQVLDLLAPPSKEER